MLRALRDHDISQRRACRLVGVDTKTVRREVAKMGAKPQASAAAPAAKAAPKKLTYKDQKRLDDLTVLLPKWQADIARLEKVLEDATLYARDPKTFDATMTQLTKLRMDLDSGETEWLELEDKRMSLG